MTFYSRKTTKQLQNLTLSIGSALGTAAVLYFFVPVYAAVIIFLVLVAHEMGHYTLANILGATAIPPLFIPVIFGAVGWTRVKNLARRYQVLVAAAGPIAGMILAIGVLIGGLLAACLPIVYVATGALVFELFNITIGSDGRKIRRARRESKQWSS